MRSIIAWIIISAIIASLFIIIMIFPPQHILTFNDIMNQHIGTNTMTDKILERSLYPCDVKVLAGGKKEIHYAFQVPPSVERLTALVTVPKSAAVTLNGTNVPDIVRQTAAKNVFFCYIEASPQSSEIRVSNCGDQMPLLQVAYKPTTTSSRS